MEHLVRVHDRVHNRLKLEHHHQVPDSAHSGDYNRTSECLQVLIGSWNGVACRKIGSSLVLKVEVLARNLDHRGWDLLVHPAVEILVDMEGIVAAGRIVELVEEKTG